jgi:hypothetical protein
MTYISGTHGNIQDDSEKTIILLPRHEFTYGSNPDQMGVQWKRTQFPVRISFAMTVNKSQGQTLNRVGMHLRDHECFSHGQMYVGCSRVRNAASLKILCARKSLPEKKINDVTRNIVHRAIVDEEDLRDPETIQFAINYHTKMEERDEAFIKQLRRELELAELEKSFDPFRPWVQQSSFPYIKTASVSNNL